MTVTGVCPLSHMSLLKWVNLYKSYVLILDKVLSVRRHLLWRIMLDVNGRKLTLLFVEYFELIVLVISIGLKDDAIE